MSCQSEIDDALEAELAAQDVGEEVRCEACTGTPLTEPLLTMTVSAPASMRVARTAAGGCR